MCSPHGEGLGNAGKFIGTGGPARAPLPWLEILAKAVVIAGVLILFLFCLARLAHAQQSPVAPDPALLARMLAATQSDRSNILNALTRAQAQAELLAEELARSDAKIKELTAAAEKAAEALARSDAKIKELTAAAEKAAEAKPSEPVAADQTLPVAPAADPPK